MRTSYPLVEMIERIQIWFINIRQKSLTKVYNWCVITMIKYFKWILLVQSSSLFYCRVIYFLQGMKQKLPCFGMYVSVHYSSLLYLCVHAWKIVLRILRYYWCKTFTIYTHNFCINVRIWLLLEIPGKYFSPNIHGPHKDTL